MASSKDRKYRVRIVHILAEDADARMRRAFDIILNAARRAAARAEQAESEPDPVDGLPKDGDA